MANTLIFIAQKLKVLDFIRTNKVDILCNIQETHDDLS